MQLQPRFARSKVHAAVQPPDEIHPSTHENVTATPISGGFAQTRVEDVTGAIKVSLQDCLACSGCVTSAETVLLEHQSIGELRAKLQVLPPELQAVHTPPQYPHSGNLW